MVFITAEVAFLSEAFWSRFLAEPFAELATCLVGVILFMISIRVALVSFDDLALLSYAIISANFFWTTRGLTPDFEALLDRRETTLFFL